MPRLHCKLYQHGVDLGRTIDVDGSLADAKRASAQFVEELAPVKGGAAGWGGGSEFLDYEVRILDESGAVIAKRLVTEKTWSEA